MKACFFLGLLALFFCNSLSGQTWKWAVARNNTDFGSTASQDYANTIGIDQELNLYILGISKSLSGSSCTTCYYKQLFYKYSKTGEMLWRDTLSFGVKAAATDLYGNTYMAGGNAIALYDKNGDQKWLKLTPNAWYDAITLTGTSFIVSGQNLEGITPEFGNNVTLSGNHRFFLAEFDLNGNCMWAQENGEFSPMVIKVYKNKIYACGSDLGDPNGFYKRLALFSRCGKLEKTLGNSFKDVRLIDFEVSLDGYIYFAGTYSSYYPVTLEKEEHECGCKNSSIFLIKSDLEGNVQWGKFFKGDSGGTDLKTDQYGNVYISGGYKERMQVDHFTAEAKYHETFLLKISKDGNLNFFVQSECDSAHYDTIEIRDFIVSGSKVYFAGRFSYTPKLGTIQLIRRSMYSDMLVGMLEQEVDNESPSLLVENSFKIYPNPAVNNFSIEYADPKRIGDFYSVQITNSLGQEILSFQREFTGSLIEFVDLSYLSKGIYYLKFELGDFKERKKLIVQ